MKLLIILCLVTFGLTSLAQSTNLKYDKALADSLGADEYGMKMYTLVILKTGPAEISKKEIVDSLFRGHMANIGRLVANGKMIVAGPLGKNDKNYRGIFILNSETTEEAKALLSTDPAVKAKLLEAEIFPWYGSAALPLYLPFHDKVSKTKM
ncbi:hypothetical protein GS399_07045 [Pedobacter sp. HMF7647]|uniref:YCII-related domain-containing protein n=1 Tax=Hufsiella arboris TaxID=2695275 RepID=A0A7K1Y822_9SPHI|nr:YciI family protein [Hufsiella arboris]MXV50726.1 hypothetical protein [Hufsiella arboris]